MRHLLRLFVIVLSLFVSSTQFVVGSETQAIQVPKYFVWLSQTTSVPADILYALSVKESNSKMNNNTVSPWPYTINYKGVAFRYEDYHSMITAAKRLLSEGKTAFDIGPFQVNWKWNGHRAESIEDLGNPHRNGIIASEILIEQYNKYGDWFLAAGRYHNPSNSNGHADKYTREFREMFLLIQSGEYQKKSLKTSRTNKG